MTDPTPPSPTQHPGQADHAIERARAGYEWLKRDVRQQTGEDWMPLHIREHFENDWPALLADLDAARAKLDVVCDILTATQAERDEVARELGSEALRWRAERDRMRPVVEAATAWRDRYLFALGRPGEGHGVTAQSRELVTAVDTYETQEGTDG